MVFGFFSRKPPPTTQSTNQSPSPSSIPLPPDDPSKSPRVSFASSPLPAPSPPTSSSPSPPRVKKEHEASASVEPSDTPSVQPLLTLLKAVPAPILHNYILTTLSSPPAPPTILALNDFFKELTPPPQLHCMRCHKGYFEVENTDRSCLIPHDDESALVERVKGAYETLWGCCGKTVEGDGDMGPPDGWCYEGKHTTDIKRARFRADSTPTDDKLVSCARKRCFASPAVSSIRSKRKRTMSSLSEPFVSKEDKEDKDDDDRMSVGTSSSRGPKRRKASISAPASAPPTGSKGRSRAKAKSKEFIDDSDDEVAGDKMDIDTPAALAGPPTPPLSTAKPPSSSTTASATASSSKSTTSSNTKKRARAKTPTRSIGRKQTPRSPLSGVYTANDTPASERRSASLTRAGTVPVVEIVSRPSSPLGKINNEAGGMGTVYVKPSSSGSPTASSPTLKPKSSTSSLRAKGVVGRMQSKPPSSSSSSPFPATAKEGAEVKRRNSSISLKPSALRSATMVEDDVFVVNLKEEMKTKGNGRGRGRKLKDVVDSSVDAERGK